MHKITYFFACLLLIANAAQASAHHDQKKAIIFGVTGQDGTYLAEFLLNKNYEVHGIARHVTLPGQTLSKSFSNNTNYYFHIGDVTNFSQIIHLFAAIQPDEIYNLAAQSRVKVSFDAPEDTADINALGTLRILEGIRMAGLEKKAKFFQASSSELFGIAQVGLLTEKTPFSPRSPYGVAKLYGYWITVNYRESYKIFACNGILFNHESPYRGESFVTRKITLAACRYKLGLQKEIVLGNLDAKRDWGFAKDYVEGMWMMLQNDVPDDYVLATGEAHSVREFVEQALKRLDVEIVWQGHGVDEQGINKETGEIIVRIDPKFYRPGEVECVVGNAAKAQNTLHWQPKTHFADLVKMMVEEDLKIVTAEKYK